MKLRGQNRKGKFGAVTGSYVVVVSTPECRSEGCGFESYNVGFFYFFLALTTLLPRAGTAKGPVRKLGPHSHV